MKYDKLKEKYIELFGNKFDVFRAPGRINLLGEHTDYNDGFVLPASIDKEMAFVIGKNDKHSSICHLYAYDLSESYTFDINNRSISHKEWPNYIVGVVDEIFKEGKVITGFNMVFGGDIPLGAGLSSSAALESGTATALNNIFSLNFAKVKLVKMAQMAEHHFAGVKCGIMDQFASIMGKEKSAFKLDCRTLEYHYFPLELKNFQIILCNTCIKHSLASSAYNTRRLECELGVETIKKNHPKVMNLRDVSLNLMHSYKNIMQETVYNRCCYVVEENNRVVEATKALQTKNIKRMGELMYQTHGGLSYKFDVSCKELDFLVNLTKEMIYVAGARMMGGGFGGCTINLVHREHIDAFKKIVLKQYKTKFGLDAKIYEVEITKGAEKV